MSNKMKGVLKGLRYISQIFEDEEEPEMQIGFPTDVKHVAHIGWDGPAANAPSWIQKFKEGEPGAPSNGQERRCSTGSDSVLESPSKRRSDKGKGPRRHSSVGSSADSPKRRSASETRTKNSAGLDSPSCDTSSGTKTSRRRKTKTGSKSKPTSTTPELVYSDSGVASTATRSAGNGLQSKDSCQSTVLTASENDQISLDDKIRQIRAM